MYTKNLKPVLWTLLIAGLALSLNLLTISAQDDHQQAQGGEPLTHTVQAGENL